MIRRLAVVGAVLAALSGGAAAVRARPSPARPTVLARVAAPSGVRIRVQVLNATSTRGLGRRATAFLRDRGFDVVDVATAPAARDSTLVIDWSGHDDWAALVGRAFGGARVEPRSDSSRYLDVTVILGRAWRAPAEPFYP
jgi:hypothetical protein